MRTVLKNLISTTLLLSLLVIMLGVQTTLAQDAVVYAVLFYSPSCGHCHKVINEDLPPLFEKYEGQINMIGIDVTQEAGQALYLAAIQKYNVPESRYGVPALIVGENYLIGSREIPELFPGIIEDGLSKGGIDWPDIPGLEEILEYQKISAEQSEGEDTATPEPQQTITQEKEIPTEKNITDQSEDTVNNQDIKTTEEISRPQIVTSTDSNSGTISLMAERFNQDKNGNTVSVIVLIGMIASVFAIGYGFINESNWRLFNWPNWSILVLIAIGMIVAIYLSYVEVTFSDAVCGPVGDCNSVQESQYASLFGVIPVGLLGIAGYLGIIVAWLVQRYGPESLKSIASIAIWGMAWVGVLFSIYLTFLEPFVIGATCMWCITSAIVMTLILWASTGPVLEVWKTKSEFPELESMDEQYESEETNEIETSE